MPVPDSDIDLQQVIISNQHNAKLFSKLEQYLNGGSDASTTRCSPLLMRTLIQIIQRELKNNQYHNVNTVLTCIQHITSDADNDGGLQVLLENGLPELLVFTYEAVIRCTSTYSSDHQQSPADTCLLQLLETVNDVADFSSSSKENLARLFVEKLMVFIVNHGRNFATRMEAIRTLNLLLEGCPAACLKHLQGSDEIHKMLGKFAEFLPRCGDFEMQVACTETLARMVKKSDRETFSQRSFQDVIAERFLKIRDECFEVDCRTFLNTLNESQDHDSRVISIACREAFLGSYRLRCPQDDQLVEMWVDFNSVSRSITIYVADDSSSNEESSMWETVTISDDSVVKCEIKRVGDLQHLSMTLNAPASQILEFCPSDACTALIMFSTAPDLHQPLAMCFSPDKIQNQVRRKTSECSIKVLFKRLGEGGGIVTENVYTGRGGPQDNKVHQNYEKPKSLTVPLKRAKISAPISPMTSKGHPTQPASEQRRKPDVQPKTPQHHPPKRAKTPLNVTVADKMSGDDKTTPRKTPVRHASSGEDVAKKDMAASKKTPVRRPSSSGKQDKFGVESTDLNGSSENLLNDGELLDDGEDSLAIGGKATLKKKTPTRPVPEGRRKKKKKSEDCALQNGASGDMHSEEQEELVNLNANPPTERDQAAPKEKTPTRPVPKGRRNKKKSEGCALQNGAGGDMYSEEQEELVNLDANPPTERGKAAPKEKTPTRPVPKGRRNKKKSEGCALQNGASGDMHSEGQEELVNLDANPPTERGEAAPKEKTPTRPVPKGRRNKKKSEGCALQNGAGGDMHSEEQEELVNLDANPPTERGKAAPKEKTPTRPVPKGRRNKEKSEGCALQNGASEDVHSEGQEELLDSDANPPTLATEGLIREAGGQVDANDVEGDVSDDDVGMRRMASRSGGKRDSGKSSKKSSDAITQDHLETLAADVDQDDENTELVTAGDAQEILSKREADVPGEEQQLRAEFVDIVGIQPRQQGSQGKGNQRSSDPVESVKRQDQCAGESDKKEGRKGHGIPDSLAFERHETSNGLAGVEKNGKGKGQRGSRKEGKVDGSKSDSGTGRRRSSRGHKDGASEKGFLSDQSSSAVQHGNSVKPACPGKGSRRATRDKDVAPEESDGEDMGIADDLVESGSPHTELGTSGGPSLNGTGKSTDMAESPQVGAMKEKNKSSRPGVPTMILSCHRDASKENRVAGNEEIIPMENMEQQLEKVNLKKSTPGKNAEAPSAAVTIGQMTDGNARDCVDLGTDGNSQLVVCETQEMVPLADQRPVIPGTSDNDQRGVSSGPLDAGESGADVGPSEGDGVGTRASQRLKSKKTGEEMKPRKKAAAADGLDSLKPSKRKSTSGRFKLYSGAKGLLEDDSQESVNPSTYQSQDSMADFVPDSCPTQQNQHNTRFPNLSDIPERSTESTSSGTEEMKKPKRPRRKPKGKPCSKQAGKKGNSKKAKTDGEVSSESSTLHTTREFLSTSLPALAPEEHSADPYLFSDIKDSGKESFNVDEKASRTKQNLVRARRPNLNVPDKESFQLKKSFMSFPSKSLTSTVMESSLQGMATGGGDKTASAESAAGDTSKDKPETKTRKRMTKRQRDERGSNDGNPMKDTRGRESDEDTSRQDLIAVRESVKERKKTKGRRNQEVSTGKSGNDRGGQKEDMSSAERRKDKAAMSHEGGHGEGRPSEEEYEHIRQKSQRVLKKQTGQGMNDVAQEREEHSLGGLNGDDVDQAVGGAEEGSNCDNSNDETTGKESGKQQSARGGKKLMTINKRDVDRHKLSKDGRLTEHCNDSNGVSQHESHEEGRDDDGEIDGGHVSSPAEEYDNISDVELVISQYNTPRRGSDREPAEESDEEEDRGERGELAGTPNAGGDSSQVFKGNRSEQSSGVAVKGRNFSQDIHNVSDIEVMRDAAGITDNFEDDQIEGYLSSLKQFLEQPGKPKGPRKKEKNVNRGRGKLDKGRIQDGMRGSSEVEEADGEEPEGRRAKKKYEIVNADNRSTKDEVEEGQIARGKAAQGKHRGRKAGSGRKEQDVDDVESADEGLKEMSFIGEAIHEKEHQKGRRGSSKASSSDGQKNDGRKVKKDKQELSDVSSDENIQDEMEEINQELRALSRELQVSRKRKKSGDWARSGEEDQASQKSHSSKTKRPKDAGTPASAADGSWYGSEIDDDDGSGEVSDVNLDFDDAKTDATVASFSKICESLISDSAEGIAKNRTRRHVPIVDYRDKDTSYSDEDYRPSTEAVDSTTPTTEMETGESSPAVSKSCLSTISDRQSEKSWLVEKSHMKVSTYSKIQRMDWTKGTREDLFKTVQKTTTHRKRERLESDNIVTELFAPKKRRKKDVLPEVDQADLYYLQGPDDHELGEEQRNVQKVLSRGPQMESTPSISLQEDKSSSSRRIYMKQTIPGSSARSRSSLGKKFRPSVAMGRRGEKNATPRLSYSPNLPQSTEVASLSRQRERVEPVSRHPSCHSEFVPRGAGSSRTSAVGSSMSAQTSCHSKTNKKSSTEDMSSRGQEKGVPRPATPPSCPSRGSGGPGDSPGGSGHGSASSKQGSPRSHRSRKSEMSCHSEAGGGMESEDGLASPAAEPSQVTSTQAVEPDSQGITTEGEAARDSDSSIVDENCYLSGPASVREVSRSTLRRKYQHLIDDITKDQDTDEQDPEDTMTNLPPVVTRKPLNPRRLFEEQLRKQEDEEEVLEVDDHISDADGDDHDNDEEEEDRVASSSGPSLWNYQSESSSFQITDMMAMLGQRIQKQMAEKKQQAKLVTDSALRATKSHVNKIWMNQNKRRVAAHQQFTESLIDEIVGLEMDVSSMAKTSEKMQALLRKTRTSIDSKYSKALKTLHDNHMKELSELDDCLGRNLKKSVRAIMGQELASMRNRIVGDLQMQDMNQMRMAMQSFFDISMDSTSL